MPVAKPEMEFTDTASAFLWWQPVPGAPAGLEEKILSRDPAAGDYSFRRASEAQRSLPTTFGRKC